MHKIKKLIILALISQVSLSLTCHKIKEVSLGKHFPSDVSRDLKMLNLREPRNDEIRKLEYFEVSLNDSEKLVLRPKECNKAPECSSQMLAIIKHPVVGTDPLIGLEYLDMFKLNEESTLSKCYIIDERSTYITIRPYYQRLQEIEWIRFNDDQQNQAINPGTIGQVFELMNSIMKFMTLMHKRNLVGAKLSKENIIVTKDGKVILEDFSDADLFNERKEDLYFIGKIKDKLKGKITKNILKEHNNDTITMNLAFKIAMAFDIQKLGDTLSNWLFFPDEKKNVEERLKKQLDELKCYLPSHLRINGRRYKMFASTLLSDSYIKQTVKHEHFVSTIEKLLSNINTSNCTYQNLYGLLALVIRGMKLMNISTPSAMNSSSNRSVFSPAEFVTDQLNLIKNKLDNCNTSVKI